MVDFERCLGRTKTFLYTSRRFLGLVLLILIVSHATAMDITKEAGSVVADNVHSSECVCPREPLNLINAVSLPINAVSLPTHKYVPPKDWWIVSLVSIVAVITVTFCLSALIYAVRPPEATTTELINNELLAAETLATCEEGNKNMDEYIEYLSNTIHEVPCFARRS